MSQNNKGYVDQSITQALEKPKEWQRQMLLNLTHIQNIELLNYSGNWDTISSPTNKKEIKICICKINDIIETD